MWNQKNSKTAQSLSIFLGLLSLMACGSKLEVIRLQKETVSMDKNAPLFEENIMDEGYVSTQSEIITKQNETSPPSTQSRSILKKISTIRVKIFPHLEQYSTPHGRELTPERVVIQSTGTCELKDSKGLLAKGSTWSLSIKNVTKKISIQCDEPIEVIRGAGVRGKRLNSRKYEGYLEIYPKAFNGRKILEVVNVIDFEKYLKGVVPSEVILSWDNLEVFKVQAVAARTFSYQLLSRKNSNADYDLDDTVKYQAYTGLSKSLKKTNQAVEMTKNEIMTYNGRVIQAFFSADSGGYTEDARYGFDGNIYLPYVVAKKDPFPRSALLKMYAFGDYVKKISSMQVKNILRVLNLSLGGASPQLFIADSERTESGRAKSIYIKTADGSVKKRKIKNFQNDVTLGTRLITFTSNRGPYVLSAKGYGHGVGLSQWGAQVLTSAPYFWSYEKVLEYYYNDAKMVTLQ